MFILKEIVSQFLLPLSLCIEFLLAGLILLWFTRKQRTGMTLVTLGTILLILLSDTFIPVSDFLLRGLEYKYPALTIGRLDKSTKWIVVLGANYSSDRRLPLSNRLGDAATFRLLEGIRLYKEIPGSKIILSGGPGASHIACAEVMANVAQMLGIRLAELVLEPESKDTESEARLIKPLVADDRFIMVTSAAHMPRAMALFEKLGMHPIAAPTDYLVRCDGDGGVTVDDFSPDPGAFLKATVAFHEYLGTVWATLRGEN